MTWYSIPTFVETVTEAVEDWLGKYGSTMRVKHNLERFARLRPEGLLPFVTGAPVIA